MKNESRDKKIFIKERPKSLSNTFNVTPKAKWFARDNSSASPRKR